MRVISGVARGRRLKAPRGLGTRPFLDSMKESLFNIIAGEVVGAGVLDLFSGSGSLGIEALSRGAREAVMVESDPAALGCLSDNLQSTGLFSRATVVRGRLPRALDRVSGSFDIAFVDPPYRQGLVAPTLVALVRRQLLAPGGLAVVHAPAGEELPGRVEKLALVRDRIYGQAVLAFYRMATGEGTEDG